MTHPQKVEIAGIEKNVVFFYYTKTLAESPTRSIINNKKGLENQQFTLNLEDGEDLDLVYYVEFDAREVLENDNDWASLLENGVLVWGK